MIGSASYPNSDDCDVVLMRRIRNNEMDAFVELFDKYHRRVVRAITKMLGCQTHSEDLAQQVFLRVYRARDHYEPTAKFTTWLFTITRNVVFNAHRSLTRRQDRFHRFSSIQHDGCPSHFGLSAEPDPPTAAVKLEVQQAVQQALDQLGGRQQQAIRLVFFGGYSYRAAAEQMDATVNSVKQLVVRGKGKLKVLLETNRVGCDLPADFLKC
ncbi:RNA polymerase sigma factor [Stieleria tagensis]|uniref:RNA polymerase sigma factor n=1 Tax=Stieleria tagensis TaxID=2956795 RepID=UPI00209AE4AC|nr:sigma-70 family RNA polymerase sigma factor [Stieleria tagensis]